MIIDIRKRVLEIIGADKLAEAVVTRGGDMTVAMLYLKNREELLQRLEAEIKTLEEKAWQYESLCK